MSQYSSWFVEFSLEIHASVSLQGMQCHRITLLALELTQAFVCSLFFPPTTLIVFLAAWKKCGIPLSEPLDDHWPRFKLFRRSGCVRGAEGVCSHQVPNPFKSFVCRLCLSNTYTEVWILFERNRDVSFFCKYKWHMLYSDDCRSQMTHLLTWLPSWIFMLKASQLSLPHFIGEHLMQQVGCIWRARMTCPTHLHEWCLITHIFIQ